MGKKIYIKYKSTLITENQIMKYTKNRVYFMARNSPFLSCSSANTPVKTKQTPNRILVRTCDGLELRDPPYLPASPSPPRLAMQGHMDSSRTSLFGGGMGYGSAK